MANTETSLKEAMSVIEGATGVALDQIDAAKEICAVCPVNPECLEFALATNQEAGVWGGTTEEERRKLRKGWLAKQRAS